jgi:hypothetical protein
MTLRIIAATTACIGFLVAATFASADGMPEPEDENFNPVPSVPAKPAPGVTQPAPIKPAKPAPAAAPKPAPAPVVNAPEPTPPPDEPEDLEPAAPAPTAPAPAPTPSPTTTTPAPTPAPTTPAATTPATTKQQIHEILSVDVQVTPKPAATITVKATASTGGWKDIELKPLQTFAAEIGMRSYTLVGTPPSDPTTQALSPVSVTTTLDPLPADVKTIRVLGKTNEVSQTFR